MIITPQQTYLNDVLNQVAIELDIPPHKYKQAMERYDAIRRHLEAGTYPNSASTPSIYLQGSFRYGTVIRPIQASSDCGYDIDIVCEIDRKKTGNGSEELKSDVGEEVKGYASSNGMSPPKDSRRCWALKYAADSEGIGFHVDVLPCLPDRETGSDINTKNYGQGGTDWQYTQTCIAITNRDDDDRYDWRSSNPNGYARWFKDICDPGFAHVDNVRQKQLLFETYGQRENFPFTRAEDIPDALVRTPLQRAIQIMKRHRDTRFSQLSKEDQKHKPISMIITTLAARLYQGRASQYQTTRSVLRFIVETLAQHVGLTESRVLLKNIEELRLIQRVGDTWYIPNPVNPHNPGDAEDKGENFADRWHEDDHAKAKAFFQWVEWLRNDLDELLNNTGNALVVEKTLTEAFGKDVATRAVGRRQAGASAPISVKSPYDVPHRQQPKWPVNLTHQVTVQGKATRDGWQTLMEKVGFRGIAKRYSLRFVAKTDVTEPYEVYWQVVNTGQEAASAGQLRGDFKAGGLIHTETTKYTGFHWVECFIVKGGIVVARSGEFEVNIK